MTAVVLTGKSLVLELARGCKAEPIDPGPWNSQLKDFPCASIGGIGQYVLCNAFDNGVSMPRCHNTNGLLYCN